MTTTAPTTAAAPGVQEVEDAGHFDVLALQGSHQRIHELVAPPHQHHEVAGVQKGSVARSPLPADQTARMPRDQPRQPLVRQRQAAG